MSARAVPGAIVPHHRVPRGRICPASGVGAACCATALTNPANTHQHPPTPAPAPAPRSPCWPARPGLATNRRAVPSPLSMPPVAGRPGLADHAHLPRRTTLAQRLENPLHVGPEGAHETARLSPCCARGNRDAVLVCIRTNRELDTLVQGSSPYGLRLVNPPHVARHILSVRNPRERKRTFLRRRSDHPVWTAITHSPLDLELAAHRCARPRIARDAAGHDP